MTKASHTVFSKEVRFSVWEAEFERVYSHRCSFSKCSNIIKVSNFEVAYLDGILKPVCNKCKLNENQTNEEEPLINTSKFNKWWLCCFSNF